LHGAVFAEGPVQHGKNHVDFRMRPRLRHDRPWIPLAFPVDEVLRPLVFRGIHRVHDGARRAHRHFVLTAAAAVDDGYSQFHRIRFPNPDMISSTARSAVRLTSSITGFTSTTSSETMPPESQIISIAKCASRYVAPPRTGVPTPGASRGSTKSMSSDR